MASDPVLLLLLSLGKGLEEEEGGDVEVGMRKVSSSAWMRFGWRTDERVGFTYRCENEIVRYVGGEVVVILVVSLDGVLAVIVCLRERGCECECG